MFERLHERVRRLAEARADAKAAALAETLAAELPPGLRTERTEQGVGLSGRGLRQRMALEPELRRLIGRQE
jgi:ABC-type protease/lipase transport system fused ATPase/permease subunit